MKLLKDVVFKTDFSTEYYQNEIEKFINELKRINEPAKLSFGDKSGPTEKKLIYDGVTYKGYYKSFAIEVNKSKIGKIECFKSNDNKFFMIYVPKQNA